MRKISIYILLLLSVLMVSCTKENTEECFSGVRLRFRFTLHEESEKGNLFGQNVRNVKVYVFDQNGVLQQIATEKGAVLKNDYVMSLDLEPGRYSLVAWASDNEELSRTHRQMHAVDMTQNPCQYRELEIGKSCMGDLCLILETQQISGYPETIKPKVDNFDDLYFGAVGTRSSDGKSQYSIVPIDVKISEVVEREIELIRNTNILRVAIEGLDNMTGATPKDMLDIWVTGANTQYQHNNIIEPHALCARYFPQYSASASNTVQADVKIERLVWDEPNEAAHVKLNVQFKNGKVLYSGDLLPLLKRAKDATGNYIYKNQEDLDRIYTHPIRFVIEGANVRVFIHDWEVIILKPEI